MDVSPWKIDKTINLPFLLTVFAGLGGGVIWATQVDSRLQNVEGSVARTEVTVAKFVDSQSRIERMDERGITIRRDLDRVIDRMDRDKTGGT